MRSIIGLLVLAISFMLPQSGFANIEDIVIIDVRTREEYSNGHLKGSLNIDFLKSSFKSEISKLDKNKKYKVYCRSGNRSGQAERLMKSMGFKSVDNVGSLQQAAKELDTTCIGTNAC